MKKAYHSEFLQLCKLLIDPTRRENFPQMKHYLSLYRSPEPQKLHIKSKNMRGEVFTKRQLVNTIASSI